jgi:regulatory protein SWI5
MQRGRSLQGIVENVEQKSFEYSPPSTAPLMQSSTFDYAEMPVPERHLSPQVESSFEPQIIKDLQAYGSPSKPVTPIRSAFELSSHEEPLPFFDETGGEVPQIEDHPIPVLSSSQAPAGSMSPNRPALSPRRMSITDLNLEPGIKASIEDTNISIDDIAQFIEGPGPIDSKYMCTYEDCGKKFGRKENIKSHVQTHLGDRQFRCDHCKKCFVRGHDLKRHAKIHTGTKPYPCLCGNSFARHDALTRHRQRGMCIGAFEGVVKKDVKRGRPKKRRPEMDDRLDKSTKTRRKNEDNVDPSSDYGSQYDGQYGHYASSASSDSISSWGSPPTENLEGLSIRGDSPFDDMALFGGNVGQATHMSPGHTNIGLPPNVFTSQAFTPPTSPPYMGSPYSTGHKPSPTHTHRSLTPTELTDIPELPTMQIHQLTTMAIQKSHQSLPSLSHSGSSPAAEAFAFDFSDDAISSHMHLHSGEIKGENIFDPFLNYGNEMEGDSIDFSSL